MNGFQIPTYLDYFLQQPWEAVLSTIGPRGLPQQTVMWFGRRENQLFLTCLERRVKVRNLKLNPKASLLVVGSGCYVSFQGQVRIDFSQVAAQENLETLARRYLPERRQVKMLQRLTDPNRATLWFQITTLHSHRIKNWNLIQGDTRQSTGN